MRSQRAIKNLITSVLQELTAIACGLLLPRLVLSHFGSAYNGVTASIAQFLGCAALLRAGVGSVTRAALYRPLAEGDMGAVSAIVNTAETFMRRTARLFGVGLLAFAALYPLLVRSEFEWLFSASLALILGVSTFVQYYFGSAYLMLLEADQRLYVHHIINIGTTAANTAVAALLILAGCSIHMVKLGSALVFCLNPLFVRAYVRRHYALRPDAPPDAELLSQRRDALFHELAGFVSTNTDMIVLTVFTNVREVSVYSMYCLVTNALQKLISTASASVGSAFGDLLARGERDTLETQFRRYENAVFSVSVVCFACTAVLITPFLSVYTRGVHDVSYHRPVFGYMMSAAAFFACVRQPYKTLVYAMGHFRQTRGGAIAEAAVNLALSVALVLRFGLTGVAVGTLFAFAFRTVQYAYYLCRRVFGWRFSAFCKRLLVSAGNVAGIVACASRLPLSGVRSYGDWLLCACAAFAESAAITLAFDLVFYRAETLGALREFCKKWGDTIVD